MERVVVRYLHPIARRHENELFVEGTIACLEIPYYIKLELELGLLIEQWFMGIGAQLA